MYPGHSGPNYMPICSSPGSRRCFIGAIYLPLALPEYTYKLLNVHLYLYSILLSLSPSFPLGFTSVLFLMEPPSKGDVLIIPGPSSINPEKIRVEWNQLFNSGAHDYYSIEASNRSRSEWTVFCNVACL